MSDTRGRYTPVTIVNLQDTDDNFSYDTDGWIIQWDKPTQEWIYISPATLGNDMSLGDISDVSLTPEPMTVVEQYDHLEWNGSEWENTDSPTFTGPVICEDVLIVNLDEGTVPYINSDGELTRSEFLLWNENNTQLTTQKVRANLEVAVGIGTPNILMLPGSITLSTSSGSGLIRHTAGNFDFVGVASGTGVTLDFVPFSGGTGTLSWDATNFFSLSHALSVSGTLDVTGVTTLSSGLALNTTRLTGNTTLNGTQQTIYCDTDNAAGGAFTVTLDPIPADGQTYRIINVGSDGNDLTIDENGNALLGSVTTDTLADGEAVILTYETTEGWW
jgi:hypothetical protein